MDPNYEWKFENGMPVALTGAFGIKLPEEIEIDRLFEIQEKIMITSSKFIEESEKANSKLQKSLPKKAAELQFARAFMYYQLHLHQEETGVKITFVDRGDINASWNKRDEKESFEGLNESDENRALVVKTCEEYVLKMAALLEANASRKELKITPRQLYEACRSKLPWFGGNDSDEERVKTFQLLLGVLMEDCWVVFNNEEGQSNLLPYGKGVPQYDEDLGVEHPIWNN
tara:strand:+ start:841 stop:1527 length:687 start_codon:yes stop_codon:yes gene_type:complete